MAKVTGPKVGPGTYKIKKVIDYLKQKPCKVKYNQCFLKHEDCYEIVNNIRVLQPKYIRRNSLKAAFQQEMQKYESNQAFKRINDTFVFQNAMIWKEQEDNDYISMIKGYKKSRNNIPNSLTNIEQIYRPKTQQNGRLNKTNKSQENQLDNLKKINNQQIRELNNSININQINSQHDKTSNYISTQPTIDNFYKTSNNSNFDYSQAVSINQGKFPHQKQSYKNKKSKNNSQIQYKNIIQNNQNTDDNLNDAQNLLYNNIEEEIQEYE